MFKKAVQQIESVVECTDELNCPTAIFDPHFV